jgi:hypothetical protein
MFARPSTLHLTERRNIRSNRVVKCDVIRVKNFSGLCALGPGNTSHLNSPILTFYCHYELDGSFNSYFGHKKLGIFDMIDDKLE